MPDAPAVALITGGSRGLGRALLDQLVATGWQVVIDGRDTRALAAAVAGTVAPARVTAIAGDVADPAHRRALAAAVDGIGQLDLLVNNASTLGPTPLPPLAEAAPDDLHRVFGTNTLAPLALIQALLPVLRRSGGRIINVSSDAAVQAYPGWGLYGSAKAALDQLSAVLAAEEPSLRVYAVDPGDMDTDLHRQAAPDDDPAGLLAPKSVAAQLLPLTEGRLPSGRYLAAELPAGARAGDRA